MTSAPRAYESAHQTAGMLQLHCARRTPARFTSIAILLHHALQQRKYHQYLDTLNNALCCVSFARVPTHIIKYHIYAKISVRFDTKKPPWTLTAIRFQMVRLVGLEPTRLVNTTPSK